MKLEAALLFFKLGMRPLKPVDRLKTRPLNELMTHDGLVIHFLA